MTPADTGTPLISDEVVEAALEAANGVMVDTRRYWTAGDKAAVRAMLEAALMPRSEFLRKYPNVILSSLHDACDQQISKLETALSASRAEVERVKREQLNSLESWLLTEQDFRSDITQLRADLSAARKALSIIAAFDDVGASAHLVATGSYSKFDEPLSVNTARKALTIESAHKEQK